MKRDAAMSERTIFVSTIIDSHNYGTVLQAVATNDILTEYGTPVFIDYRRREWENSFWFKTYMAGNHSKPVNLLRFLLSVPGRVRSQIVFRGFIERSLELCEASPFLSGGSFDNNAVYVVGSDQTWNAVCNNGIDPVYYLKSVPDSCKKISFAASFGRSELDESESVVVKGLLSEFESISVREKSSVDLLNSIGVQGAIALKDPVLLCRNEYWHELASCIPKEKQPFILLYMLNDNKRMVDYAKRLSQQKGVRLKCVTFNPFKHVDDGVESVCLPRVERWVALFRDAAYVVTDSFHGTCFSLVFNNPMTVFDPPRFSVRLTDVLSDFELEDRRAPIDMPVAAIDVHRHEVDWGDVELKKSQYAQEARDYLNDCKIKSSN